MSRFLPISASYLGRLIYTASFVVTCYPIFSEAQNGGSELNLKATKQLTEEELVANRDELSRQRAESAAKVVAPPIIPPAPAEPEDLIKSSTIISFGGNLTLVPRGAVLYTPENFAARLIPEPDAKVLGWNEFLLLNRGWITTTEITMAQAEGVDLLPAANAEKMKKGGNLVVAVFEGNPISMLPPKPPAKPANDSKANTLEK
jgi:hypothetical protein